MENKQASFEVIRKHLFDEDGDLVQLTQKQSEMMERWNYAIELRTCQQLTTKDIIPMMMMKFGVERTTAFNDLGYAEALFGYSTPLNKRYRIGARIDYLEDKIKLCYEKEEYKAAAILESCLLKYYEEYPELKKQETPRTLNFVYAPKEQSTLIPDLPSISDAEVILMEKNG